MPESKSASALDQAHQLDVAELLKLLEFETRAALNRVYQLDDPTPMDSVELDNGCVLMLKREDLSKVHSYKWRGSFNKISAMHEQKFSGALIAASAGNHAQGVAAAAHDDVGGAQLSDLINSSLLGAFTHAEHGDNGSHSKNGP